MAAPVGRLHERRFLYPARNPLMRRWCSSLLLVAVCAVPARAHFVWIVPFDGPTGTGAQVVFSDNLEPDPNVPIAKVKATEVGLVAPGKKVTALKLTPVEGKN